VTALIVIGCIVLLIALLLSFSVTVYVHITEEVDVAVGAFGFKKNIDYPTDESEKKKKKPKKKKQKKKKKNSMKNSLLKKRQ